MQPTDSEVELAAFAGEVHHRPAARRPHPWRTRLRETLRIGVVAGMLPTAMMVGVYYLQHHALALPWPRLATVAALFGTSVGVSLAVAVDLMVALFDRVAALGFGLRWMANPATAGAFGGGLAGIGPGIVATTAFHDYRGPFVGAALIGSSLIAGALLVAVPLARRARRDRRPPAPGDRRAIAGATFAATLIGGLAWALCSPMLVNYAYGQAFGAVTMTGAVAGAIAGSAGGAALGLYVGLVITLGRGRRAT